MPPRRADLVGDEITENIGGHGGKFRFADTIDKTHVGALVRSERNDLQPCILRGFGEALVLTVVAVEHGRPARLRSFEDFRLGVGDLLHRLEEADVDRFHRCNDRDLRAHHFA